MTVQFDVHIRIQGVKWFLSNFRPYTMQFKIFLLKVQTTNIDGKTIMSSLQKLKQIAIYVNKWLFA